MERSRDGSIHVTDEIINTITHTVGAILAIFGTSVLIIQATKTNAIGIIAAAIYGASVILLFVASSLLHGLSKRVTFFRKFDYTAIYVLIAGTFMPFIFREFPSEIGWAIFGVLWATAIFGIILQWTTRCKKWFSSTLYITMGWFGIFAVPYLLDKLTSLMLLVLGGIAYTIGAIVFTVEKPNLIPGKFGFHEIWHMFVLLGAILHWISIYLLYL